MATHSSVLAWRIPGMGEPGGLLSVGSHRVRHDWSDLSAAAAVAICTSYSKKCLFCPFFDWVFVLLILSSNDYLHILDINSLLAISLFPILYVVFVLLTVSFAAQTFLSLIRLHLFIFAFISFALRQSKVLLWFMSMSILPMFSHRKEFNGFRSHSEVFNQFWVYLFIF